ncbi:hypothetical protein NKR23_g233 [Pleurostoma richardsiae]|uniref:SnoaL-like domain-containing protein n=1 Tax=Pleurostoma richardsiae TaxID=41990 RepID=A0AA38VXQ8_9PEZI|nr:hypothetical protein NKR23_g233 [Pleurostoma richardsiae]
MADITNPLLPQGWSVDSDIIQFFIDFYKISDSPTAHDTYTGMFTGDATFKLASSTSIGREDILAKRRSMWSTVSSREHTVVKIFPFGPNAHEFMLYGGVKYTFETGQKAEKDWAARADLAKGPDGKWRMKYYQVYLDTGANAK